MNDETVLVQKGLQRFFVYLLISAVLGFFLNFLIQKTAQEAWRPYAGQFQERGLSIDPPRIVFSRSGWPVLGAQFTQARFEKNQKCFAISAELKDVFVPLPVFRLLMGSFRLGDVDANLLTVRIHELPDCLSAGGGETPSESAADWSLNPSSNSEAGSSEPSAFALFDKWFSWIKESAPRWPVSNITIDQLDIEGSTLRGKKLRAAGSASFQYEDRFDVRVTLNPLVFEKNGRSIATQFTARFSGSPEDLHLKGDWGYYEGHLIADITYKANQDMEIALNSRDLPVSVVNRWFDTPWSFQFLWFNCQLGWQGRRAEWAQQPWAISNCKIAGPHGEVKVSSESTSSLKTIHNLLFTVYSVQLDKILKGKEHLPLHGIFKGLGILDGEVHVEQNGQIASRLKLKDSQVLFSRKNQRKLQVIEEMNLEYGYRSGIYSGIISRAKLAGGVFEGFLALDYNKKLDRAQGSVTIQQLAFSQEIQNIMWAGNLTPLSLHGTFEFGSGFKLETAKVRSSFKSFEGSGLTLNQAQFISEWQNKALKVTGSLAKARIEKGSVHDWLLTTMLESGLNRDVLSLSQVHAEGQVSAEGVQLDKLVGTSPGARLEMSGAGTSHQGEGQLQWAVAQKNYAWRWAFDVQGAQWTPLRNDMVEWLKLNDHFLKEHAEVRLPATSEP